MKESRELKGWCEAFLDKDDCPETEMLEGKLYFQKESTNDGDIFRLLSGNGEGREPTVLMESREKDWVQPFVSSIMNYKQQTAEEIAEEIIETRIRAARRGHFRPIALS